MKKLMAVSILTVFASSASAQVYTNGVRAMGTSNNIIYNVSPLPPVLQGNQITYPSGTASVNTSGQPTSCNGPLIIDGSSGVSRITCNTPGVTTGTNADLAAALSDLAPAAGGQQATGERNLGSDSRAGLRNDRSILR